MVVGNTYGSNIKNEICPKPSTHKGCLYHGTYKDEEILFLQQVDDFAVAATNENATTALINEIDSHLIINIKDLGLLN